jgi:hypothetical protein
VIFRELVENLLKDVIGNIEFMQFIGRRQKPLGRIPSMTFNTQRKQFQLKVLESYIREKLLPAFMQVLIKVQIIFTGKLSMKNYLCS